jgi:hypothetical protein
MLVSKLFTLFPLVTLDVERLLQRKMVELITRRAA